MLYIKAHLNDQVEIKIDLYEDEIFNSCADCGKEEPVSEEELIEILKSPHMDFQGTTHFCSECTKERRNK